MTKEETITRAGLIWGAEHVFHVEPSQRGAVPFWYVDLVDHTVHRLDATGVPVCHEGCRQIAAYADARRDEETSKVHSTTKGQRSHDPR